MFIDNEQTFENKKDVKVEDDPIEEDNNIFKLPDDVEEATPTIKVPPYSDNGISSNANENTFGLDNQNHEMNIKIKENEEINITLEVNKAKQKKYGIDNFQIKDPKNGQLSKVDTEQGEVIYKPGLGFFGDDSFEYNVIYSTDPDASVPPENGIVNLYVQQNEPLSTNVKAIANTEPEVVESRTEIILDGSESVGDNLEYNWDKISGPKVNIQESNNEIAKVIAPDVNKDKELVFELTVVDSNGFEDTDQVTVKVNELLSDSKEKTGILINKIQPELKDDYIIVYGQLVNTQNNNKGISNAIIEFNGDFQDFDPNPITTDNEGYFHTQVNGPFKSSNLMIYAIYNGDLHYLVSTKEIPLIISGSNLGSSTEKVQITGTKKSNEDNNTFPVIIILIGILIGGIIGAAIWKLKKTSHVKNKIEPPNKISETIVTMKGGLYDPQQYNFNTLPHISNLVKEPFNIEIITLSGVE